MELKVVSNEVGQRGRPRLRRVGLPAPLRLTGSQREVLQLLYEYGFLTIRLLAVAYGSRAGREGRGYWHLQRELRRLFDAGMVERFPGAVRAARAGSDECVYAITHRGGRVILDAIDYARARHDLYGRERKHRANFGHHVAVATLQLVLTLGQRGWRLVDFRAEDRDPSACVRVRLKNRVHTAWPDASAVVETGTEGAGQRRRARYLFEIDLTRKSNQRVRERFAVYAQYLSEQRRQADAVRSPISPTLVVFAVSSESEIERFLEHASDALAEARIREAPSFLFWNLADWFVSGSQGELRAPAEILESRNLSTLDGDSRRLIEEGAGK